MALKPPKPPGKPSQTLGARFSYQPKTPGKFAALWHPGRASLKPTWPCSEGPLLRAYLGRGCSLERGLCRVWGLMESWVFWGPGWLIGFRSSGTGLFQVSGLQDGLRVCRFRHLCRLLACLANRPCQSWMHKGLRNLGDPRPRF